LKAFLLDIYSSKNLSSRDQSQTNNIQTKMTCTNLQPESALLSLQILLAPHVCIASENLQSSTKVLAHLATFAISARAIYHFAPFPQFNVVYRDKVIITRLQHCRGVGGVSLPMMLVMRYKCLVNAFSCYLIQVCQGLFSMIVAITFTTVKKVNKPFYYIKTSVLSGFLPLRKSIYFHM